MSQNLELEELDKSNSTQTEATIPKKRAYVFVAGAAGLISYFLPWLTLSFFGFEVYSINGLDIPTTGEMVGQWSVSLGGNSGGVSLLSILYLIPLLFIATIVMEFLARTRQIPLVAFSILILIVAFLTVLIYNIGFAEVLNLLSIGIYGALLSGIVLAFSKNW